VQSTPAAVLESAQNAVKQAEMNLNAAIEQSQQTEITAPVDGVIYYNFLADEEIKAGDVVAKIGDDKNIWIEAEVTEDIFKQVTLGKKVNYTIDGHNLTGIVMEKVAPVPQEEVAEVVEVVEETPAENPEQPTEQIAEENKSSTDNTAAENQPVDNKPAEESKSADETSALEENVIEDEPVEEKFIVRVSVPTEQNFGLNLLSETTLKIVL